MKAWLPEDVMYLLSFVSYSLALILLGIFVAMFYRHYMLRRNKLSRMIVYLNGRRYGNGPPAEVIDMIKEFVQASDMHGQDSIEIKVQRIKKQEVYHESANRKEISAGHTTGTHSYG